VPVHHRWRALLAAVFSMVITVTLSGTAHADPDPAAVEQQLAEVWRQAEPLIEQYNAVHDEFVKNKAKQDELMAAIEPLAAQLAVAQARVGEMAARAYMGGQVDPFHAILASQSPRDLADQLSLLDGLAREQTSQLKEVADAKAAYDVQKAPIDTLGGPAGRAGRRPGRQAAGDRDAAGRVAGVADPGVRRQWGHRRLPALGVPGRVPAHTRLRRREVRVR
jgi:hypothetical protein